MFAPCPSYMCVLAMGLVAVYVLLHRLVLHPLARYPGPTLAALTSLYRSYYDVAKGGDWLRQLNKLHDRYGPVIRVGPTELHFKDPRAYDRIFSLKGQFTKEPTFYACFGVDESTFGAIDPVHAKERRDLLAPYFDKRAIIEMEGIIRAEVDQLVTRLSTADQPMDMFYGFRCATMDVVATHCFGRSPRMVQERDLKASLLIDIQTAVPLLWRLKWFPWLLPLLPWLPPIGAGRRLKREFHAFIRLRDFVSRELEYVSGVVANATLNAAPANSEHKNSFPPESFIFKGLSINSARMYGNASHTHLVHEALSLLQAGSDTVANTCVAGFFHILNNPCVKTRLVAELIRAFPDPDAPITWSDLEKVPYLSAVIKESLRISHGFVSPLPRVVGKEGIDILGCDVPAGTTVGISATFVHNDPHLFPQPDRFLPGRWLLDSDQQEAPVSNGRENKSKYLVPFSRGSRMCLGINMAWAELYIFFGVMFRRLDMSLVDTCIQDITDFKEFFIPLHTGRHIHIEAQARPG